MAFVDNRSGCKSSGCRNRATSGGYCDDHKTEQPDRHAFYNKTKRDPEKVKVYNSHKWKKTRRRILEKYPLCVRCNALGKYRSAQMVDHLVGFKNERDPHAWDPDFLFPLCNQCRGIVTGKEKHVNFLDMSLNEAIYLKYDGADQKPPDDTIYI